jgi:hypothetical protein
MDYSSIEKVASVYEYALEKTALSRTLLLRARDLAMQDARALGEASAPRMGTTYKKLDAALSRRRRQIHLFSGKPELAAKELGGISAGETNELVAKAREQGMYPPRPRLSEAHVFPEKPASERAMDALRGLEQRTEELRHRLKGKV